MSTNRLLAIIGGSGLYDLPGLTDTRWVTVDTPWGAPSDQIFLGRLAARRPANWPSCRATAAATASRRRR